ncbi:hypothetical protein ACFYXH_41875 [Streptomyces sp. NPDC002730]|uniref:hypothetical protein n=1 Tax=Streptomyces sp. NPDC002730 TaxID=3364662 RepID=UPI0036A13BA7
MSDEVMALLWALAGNKTLGQFTSDHVGLRDWDTSRISLFMRDELEATTNAHALYLAWPVLCEEANWP